MEPARTAEGFLASVSEMPTGLVRSIVFPGGMTSIAAPSSSGKTVTIQILAYELGRGGIFRQQQLHPARVLFIDTDNPRSLLHARLTQICQETDITLDILSREKAPKLLDVAAWDALPAQEFDVVRLEFCGATPGISERKDDSWDKPSIPWRGWRIVGQPSWSWKTPTNRPGVPGTGRENRTRGRLL